MALKDQPYLPLYIQDVLTDEKLIECSMEAHGLYFRILCLLHKQEEYGVICLKQKYKQSESKYMNFALMLVRQTPFQAKQIAEALKELSDEGVLTITESRLSQKRMVKDGEISLIRSTAGKKGGSRVTRQYGKSGYFYLMSDTFTKHKIGISVNPKNRCYRLRSDLKLKKNFDIIDAIKVNDMGLTEEKAHEFFKEYLDGEWLTEDYDVVLKDFDLFKAKIKAKSQANSEYENENENEVVNKDVSSKGGLGENETSGIWDGIQLPESLNGRTEQFKQAWQDWEDNLYTNHKFQYANYRVRQKAIDDVFRSNGYEIPKVLESVSQASKMPYKQIYPADSKQSTSKKTLQDRINELK